MALGYWHSERATISAHGRCSRRLVLARDIGHIPSTANLLAGLGVVALHQSDFRSAAALFEEASPSPSKWRMSC